MLSEARLMLREPPSTESARRVAPHLYHDLPPTRAHPVSLTLKELPLTLLDRYCSGTTQVIQAAPGYEVVFVPPGVSGTLVPLDGALVLQIVYGIVEALTVRPDTGAFCSFQKR